MSVSLAREIADEHIEWWDRLGVMPHQAMAMLTGRERPANWWMVRGRMIDWLLFGDRR